jgi:hypothetical protein
MKWEGFETKNLSLDKSRFLCNNEVMERSNPFFAALSLSVNAKLPSILLAKFANIYSLYYASLTVTKSSHYSLFIANYSLFSPPPPRTMNN